MKVCDFTGFELDFFREYCNFTPDERQLFELRTQNIPLERCAEMMNVSVSTVKRMSQRINKKIIRVC